METSSAANNFTLQWTAQYSMVKPLGTRPVVFSMTVRELPATPPALKSPAPTRGKLKTERKKTSHQVERRGTRGPKKTPYRRSGVIHPVDADQTSHCSSTDELFIDTSEDQERDCKDGTAVPDTNALHALY